MNSWQKEVIENLQNFVNQYPPSTILEKAEAEVQMGINSREAYVLLSIVEQWAKSNLPMIVVEPSKEAKNEQGILTGGHFAMYERSENEKM